MHDTAAMFKEEAIQNYVGHNNRDIRKGSKHGSNQAG
jgi:hypothetical protein